MAFNQQINAVVPEQYNILFLYVLLQMSKDYLVEDINMALESVYCLNQSLRKKSLLFHRWICRNSFPTFVKQVNKSKFINQLL